MNKLLLGAVMALITASVAASMVPKSDFKLEPIPSHTEEQRELMASLVASVNKLDAAVQDLIKESEWLINKEG